MRSLLSLFVGWFSLMSLDVWATDYVQGWVWVSWDQPKQICLGGQPAEVIVCFDPKTQVYGGVRKAVVKDSNTSMQPVYIPGGAATASVKLWPEVRVLVKGRFRSTAHVPLPPVTFTREQLVGSGRAEYRLSTHLLESFAQAESSYALITSDEPIERLYKTVQALTKLPTTVLKMIFGKPTAIERSVKIIKHFPGEKSSSNRDMIRYLTKVYGSGVNQEHD